MHTKHKQTLLRMVAGMTAGSTAWLIASPTLAAGTEPLRAPKPTGHTRTLTTGEMARIVGARPPVQIQPRIELTGADENSGGTETWEATAGSGVSTASGNKLTQQSLVGWVQRGGLPIAFTLSHSSIGATNATVGKKWTHSFNSYLKITTGGGGTLPPGGGGGTTPTPTPSPSATPPPGGDGQQFGSTASANVLFRDAHVSTPGAIRAAQMSAVGAVGDTVQVVLGDGSGETFTENVDGSYSATAGVFDTLVKNGDGSYTLTKKDLTVWRFNAAGWLQSIADKNGNTATLAYNAQNHVKSVTDATGRVLTLAWDAANPRINSVTDPAAVSGGTRFVTGYAYDAANRITTITDRRGKAWTFGYNAAGKLSTETTPLLHQTTYTYGASGTTITDARGNAQVHTYNAAGELTSVRDEAHFTESYSYNANHLKTLVTDKRGKVCRASGRTNGCREGCGVGCQTCNFRTANRAVKYYSTKRLFVAKPLRL